MQAAGSVPARKRTATDLLHSSHTASPLGERLNHLTSFASALLDELRTIMPSGVIDVRSGIDFYDEVEKFEVELIKRALERTGGHQTRAAKLLNIKITTLNSKIKKYKIDAASGANLVTTYTNETSESPSS
jgi:DNA-binding NtrC family response regulator